MILKAIVCFNFNILTANIKNLKNISQKTDPREGGGGSSIVKVPGDVPPTRHSGPDYDFCGHKSYKAQNGKECYKSLKLTKKNVFKTKFLCLLMCAVVGKFF